MLFFGKGKKMSKKVSKKVTKKKTTKKATKKATTKKMKIKKSGRVLRKSKSGKRYVLRRSKTGTYKQYI